MGTLLQDIRYGWRMLAKSPASTFIVALTLALGIGANTYIFSIINGYLLRPMDVPEAGRIAIVAARQAGDSPFLFSFSYPDFVDFRKQAAPVADLFLYEPNLGGLSADNKADQIFFSSVSGNYFSGLGLKPVLGRFILPEEENQPGRQPVLVLGYAYWQKRFGGDPRVLGKQVLVDGKPAMIVGVAPKGFHGTLFPTEMDAYMPLGSGGPPTQVSRNPLTDRDTRIYRVVGRLRPGVSFSQAQASINVIAARLANQYPSTDKNVAVEIYREQLSRPTPSNLVPIIAGFFLFLAALLLLLACMNVANMVLARATARQREMGLRAALGAARSRLIRQTLTETLLLGLLGGAGGVLLGLWCSPGRITSMPGLNLPLNVDLTFDWHVFAYSLAAALFTGLFVGLWPAVRASRVDLNTVLQEGGRSDTGGAGRHRVRNFLVAAQVAGSLMLLVIAGLFVRSVQHAGAMNLGFDPHHVLNITVDPRKLPLMPVTAQIQPALRSMAIGELVSGLGFTVAWVYFVWFHPSVNLDVLQIALAPVWRNNFWPMLFLFMSGIPAGCIGLFRPLSTLLSSLRLAIHAGTLILIAVVLEAGTWIEITSTKLPAAKVAEIVRGYNHGIRIAFLVITIIALIHVVQEVHRIVNVKTSRPWTANGLAAL